MGRPVLGATDVALGRHDGNGCAISICSIADCDQTHEGVLSRIHRKSIFLGGSETHSQCSVWNGQGRHGQDDCRYGCRTRCSGCDRYFSISGLGSDGESDGLCGESGLVQLRVAAFHRTHDSGSVGGPRCEEGEKRSGLHRGAGGSRVGCGRCRWRFTGPLIARYRVTASVRNWPEQRETDSGRWMKTERHECRGSGPFARREKRVTARPAEPAGQMV